MWVQLKNLGISPGVALYLQGVKVTLTRGFTNFNVACKWQRKYLGWAPEEGWFILTNAGEFIFSYYRLQKALLY